MIHDQSKELFWIGFYPNALEVLFRVAADSLNVKQVFFCFLFLFFGGGAAVEGCKQLINPVSFFDQDNPSSQKLVCSVHEIILWK